MLIDANVAAPQTHTLDAAPYLNAGLYIGRILGRSNTGRTLGNGPVAGNDYFVCVALRGHISSTSLTIQGYQYAHPDPSTRCLNASRDAVESTSKFKLVSLACGEDDGVQEDRRFYGGLPDRRDWSTHSIVGVVCSVLATTSHTRTERFVLYTYASVQQALYTCRL